MKPLRAFLFSRTPSGEWRSEAFRELEPLLEATRKALTEESASAAIHVGFWRPETIKIADLAQRWEGTLLLSETAIGSVPPPVAVSKNKVGEVDGLAFHVALDGFGYQIEDPSDSKPDNHTIRLTDRESVDVVFRGWVGELIRYKPECEPMLRKAGIWDDASYHECERILEVEERITLALDRYRIVTGAQASQENILDNLHACPNWFLSDQLTFLDLTVRMRNVCIANKLTIIGDLAAKGYRGLLKLPNMGNGSVHGLGKLIWEAFFLGTALRRKKWDGDDTSNDVAHSFYIPDENIVAPSVNSSFKTILDGFVDAAQVLSDQERGIWAARLGFRCDPQTLQMIGNQLGITRERVRQIEVKIYKKVRNHLIWPEVSRKLKNLLKDRTSPLLLNGVSAFDQWFNGIEELQNPLGEIFNHILDNEFSILIINDTPIISHLTSDGWAFAVGSAKNLLRGIAGEKVQEDDARVRIGTLIGERGAELRDELWETVKSFALWAEKPDGTRWLSGYGHTAEAVVTAILESAGHPLHYEEIFRRSKQISERPYEERALHNAARNVAVLYKRGTYGLLTHCPLTTEDLALIEAEIEDIAAGAERSRQWHTSELLDELLERGLDFNGQIDKYLINISLRNSKSFSYLRRMIWGYKNSWQASASSRLDTRQAVMALLEGAGRPLSTLEIRKKLENDRGLNSHFQIHPQGNLIRLGPGLWGLADRDIRVSDPDALLGQLDCHLRTTQEGVHSSEVASILDIKEEDALALLGLAKQKGMRVDRAQYVYLSSWEDSRRIWPAEAVRQTLITHPHGLSIEKIRSEVNRITKRVMNGIYVSHLLIHTDGASYDPESEIWILDQVRSQEAEVDEDEEHDEPKLP